MVYAVADAMHIISAGFPSYINVFMHLLGCGKTNLLEALTDQNYIFDKEKTFSFKELTLFEFK